MNNTLVLNHEAIALKLDRIAWQIVEEHYGFKSIVLVGLADRGSFLATQLQDRIQKIATLDIHCLEINVNKQAPLKKEVVLNDGKLLTNNAVVLIDDVLNSCSS